MIIPDYKTLRHFSDVKENLLTSFISSLGPGFNRIRFDSLFFFQCLYNSTKIVTIPGSMLFSITANLFNNWIINHRTFLPTLQVNIIVGLHTRQSSISRVIAAFVLELFICLKFQVNRKSTPCAAAIPICNASSSLPFGTTFSAKSKSAILIASSEINKLWISATFSSRCCEAIESPLLISSSTRTKMQSSNLCRWFSHQSSETDCLPAIMTSRFCRDVK